jgi:hypothetical protein
MTTVLQIAPDLGSSSSFHSAATVKSEIIPSTQFINDYLDDEEKVLILQVFIIRSCSPLLICPLFCHDLTPHRHYTILPRAIAPSLQSGGWQIANILKMAMRARHKIRAPRRVCSLFLSYSIWTFLCCRSCCQIDGSSWDDGTS